MHRTKINKQPTPGFYRLPRYLQSQYIRRAQELGVDPVALFENEQRRVLDSTADFPVCCEQNLDNCTESPANALSEEDSAMAKIKRRIMIDGDLRWVRANNEQEYAELLGQLMAQKGLAELPVNLSKHAFCEYAMNWFEVFSKPNIETATAVSYERQLRLYILPVLGEMNVEDVAAQHVQAVFNRISGTKESKKKIKTVLNMILEQAVEDGLLTRNPLTSRNVRISGSASKRTEPYTVEQMRRICNGIPQIKKEQDRSYLALQALHPLRLEEVLGLKYEDVDRENGVLHIQRSVTHPSRNQPEIKETKTAASKRDVALVKEILRYVPDEPGTHFVLGGEKPLSYQQVTRMCERIREDLAFEENITPRRFRTTVLTDIYESTKDIKQTQEAAGHTTAAMTLNHYVKGRSTNANTAASISGLYGLA